MSFVFKPEKSSLKKGSEISGKVIAIIDGDTYDVLIHDNKTIRIRMEGIDAPERGMPFFRKSKDYLAKLSETEFVDHMKSNHPPLKL